MLGSLNALFKVRLSLTVVISAVAGFFLAVQIHGNYSAEKLLYIIIGGFLITGASNILNQIIERDLDKLMSRTNKRPLPAGQMSKSVALVIAILCGIVGSYLLFLCNGLCATVGISSLILYAFVYTPLKRFSNLAVFVGAFPGALPTIIGWVAVTGTIDYPVIALFFIQFVWQFPHFWAIAWLQFDDYLKAGFSLLPSKQKDRKSAMQIVYYVFFLLPIVAVPFQFGFAGWGYLITAMVLTLGFLSVSIKLMWSLKDKAAKRVLMYSLLYLPLIQLAMILDAQA